MGEIPLCLCVLPARGQAIKQRIQSSHIPPCHRHMVIATTLSVHCSALLYCRANQICAEGCLELPYQVATECILDCLSPRWMDA